MRAAHKEWAVLTTGAISPARDRLGEAPLKMLLERVAVPLAVAGTPGAWPGKRRLMAIDGVKLDVPDIPANIAGFGRADANARPGPLSGQLARVRPATADPAALPDGAAPRWLPGRQLTPPG